MDNMEVNLCEEDLLSSIFEPPKDEFSASQAYYHDFKPNAVDLVNPPLDLPLLAVENPKKPGREGGNPEEDEGFEGTCATSSWMPDRRQLKGWGGGDNGQKMFFDFFLSSLNRFC